MTSTIVQRTQAAKQAVAQACAVCRAVQRASGETAKLLKDDQSPVSIADFASQAVIAHRLRESLGAVTLIAEEDADALRATLDAGDKAFPQAVLEAVHLVWPEATLDDMLDAIDLGNADPHADGLHGFWTCDPIDGTKGFLRGQQYAVSLAWIEGADPVIGALGCPNMSMDQTDDLDTPDPTGTIFLALAGDGAYVGPADDPSGTFEMDKILRLERDDTMPIRLCESVEKSHSAHEKHAAIVERMGGAHGSVRIDSQAKYAVVARGQADVYLRLPRPPKDPSRGRYVERIWDHAAGAIVASECGCAVSDLRGRPLDFSVGAGLESNYGLVVSDRALHGSVLDAVQHLGYDREG
ncbi:MAG: 3'(2'),5'-bisphosphate nucleotidase [Phycisphaerales bacterium]